MDIEFASIAVAFRALVVRALCDGENTRVVDKLEV